MNILKKTSGGINCLPLESVLLAQRKVFLTDPGGIDFSSANRIVQQLLFLESEDSERPVDLIISSPGGEVLAGLMIYDQLKGMTTPVNLYCTGLAASMAAIILAGGEKGRRLVLPHSKIMIHQPLIAGGIGGNASSIQRTAELIMETKAITSELLARDTGHSVEEVEAAIAFDNHMSAKEAVEWGICDKIVPRI